MSAVAINQSASAWERIEELQDEAKELRANLLKAKAEVKRCQEEAKVHDLKQGALAHAQRALETLHAKKAEGEYVSRGEITRGETAVRKATEEAQRATHAAAGIRAAAKRYEDEVEALGAKLARNRTSAIQNLRPVLLDEHLISAKEYREAVNTFVTAAVKHHGEVRAIFEFGMKMGLGDLGTYPNNGAEKFDLPVTGTHDHPINTQSFDLRASLAVAAKTKTVELQKLLP
jgi:chromosome segregation ATPase